MIIPLFLKNNCILWQSAVSQNCTPALVTTSYISGGKSGQGGMLDTVSKNFHSYIFLFIIYSLFIIVF
jgi:hypothetical protein